MSRVELKDFEYMTLDEIKTLKNNTLIKQYNDEVEGLKTDKLSKEAVEQAYGASLIDIMEAIETYKMHYQSSELFPGDPIIVYPGIKEQTAAKEFTCDFSGARISKGSLYISYRPLLKNIRNGAAYVLKRTIKVEPAYAGDLPTDIAELEMFNDKIMRHNNLDDPYIQYDHLFWQIGGGLEFKKLSRRKKYEVRYSKRPQGLQS